MIPTAQVDFIIAPNLLNFWASTGVDMDKVWEILEIDESLPFPRRIPADRISAVYRYVSNELDDPMVPYDIGSYMANQSFPLQRAVISSENLRTGFDVVLKNIYYNTGSFSFEKIEETDEKVVLETRAPILGAGSDFQVCSGVVFLARLFANSLGKTRCDDDLTMIIPAPMVPADKDVSERIAIRVVPGENFLLEISKDAWLRKAETADPARFLTAMRELRKQYARFEEDVRLYQEICEILETSLLQRNVSQDYVASQLGISVRNLQRRLRPLGTTYQQLLDDARQKLAIKLIAEGDQPLYEIAYLVGYTEPSAFYKAFRRWTGMTPGEFRQTGTDD